MKISDVLWGAANEKLRFDDLHIEGEPWWGECYAVQYADPRTGDDRGEFVLRFLRELGAKANYFCEFDEFNNFSGERQQARYNWLMFAYEVALEENL